jgi:hypothetical protein
LENLNDDTPSWQEKSYDLSAFLGATIEIVFDAQIDSLTINNSESWYIDDVRIEGDFDFPINESTLLVRVKEAASIAFDTGGPNPIEDGEQIVGQSSGAAGIVDGAPILESGTWAGNDAAGIITIKNRSESLAFQISETIYVTGSDTTVEVLDFRAKDNYIRAYYGDPSGCGSADGNLLDYQREANPRGGNIHWPPDEFDDWASDKDFFTLIQWDAVDPSVVSVPSITEPDAIIRTNEITTPSSGTFDQPELGLHTFGHGSTNIYFDDFAVQTETLSTGAITPIQE